MTVNTSKGRSNTTTTTPTQYEGLSGALNQFTGGRLGEWARTGTEKLTPEQLRAYGGAGATRTTDVERQRQRAIEEIAADPTLDVAQRQRAKQLTDLEAGSRLDAINKETEALIAEILRQNNALPAGDLETLAKIFYGGKGQDTVQKQSGQQGSFWG